jgi:hypothetical protein
MLVDAVAVYAGFTTGLYGGSVTGTVITEAMIVCMAAISLVILFKLKPSADQVTVPPPVAPPHAGPLPGATESQARLDASRFSDEGM